MMVFVGVRLCDEKYVVGPCEPCWAKELKTLVGLEAACELSCEKLRTDEVAKTAARGDDRDAASVREFRSKLEPVEASSRECAAMVVSVLGRGGDDEKPSSKFHRRAARGRSDLDDIISYD
jgi:hypothetical protein